MQERVVTEAASPSAKELWSGRNNPENLRNQGTKKGEGETVLMMMMMMMMSRHKVPIRNGRFAAHAHSEHVGSRTHPRTWRSD
jgi:hypothetical protein